MKNLAKKIALGTALLLASLKLAGCIPTQWTLDSAQDSADDAKAAAECAERQAALLKQVAGLDPTGQASQSKQVDRYDDAARKARDAANKAAEAKADAARAFAELTAATSAADEARARLKAFDTATPSPFGGQGLLPEGAPERRAYAAADAAFKRAIDKRVAAVRRLDARRPDGLPEDAPERVAYAAADAAYQRAIDKRVAAVKRLNERQDKGLPEDPADRAAYDAARAEEDTAQSAFAAAGDAVERAHARLSAADKAAAKKAYDDARAEEDNAQKAVAAAAEAIERANSRRFAADKAAAQRDYDDAMARRAAAETAVDAAAAAANKAADDAAQAAAGIPNCSQLAQKTRPDSFGGTGGRDILGVGKTGDGKSTALGHAD